MELFKLDGKQWKEYMRPFGGRFPETHEDLALLENELLRDFKIEESGKPGAVVTPLTVAKGHGHGHAHYAHQDQQTGFGPGTLALAPAFPVHFGHGGHPSPSATTAGSSLSYRMPMAAGPNYASPSIAPSSAYPTHGQSDLPDSDDDDDISLELDTECSDDDQLAKEEQEDPTPSNYLELAAELGLLENSDQDALLRHAHWKFRRSHRTFWKATGKPWSRRTGRVKNRTFRRNTKRGGAGFGKGGFHRKKRVLYEDQNQQHQILG